MIFRCTRQTLGRAQSGVHIPVRGASPRGEDLELAVQDLEQRWGGGTHVHSGWPAGGAAGRGAVMEVRCCVCAAWEGKFSTTRVRTHMRTQTYMHTQTHMHTPIPKNTQTYMHTLRACTCACTHMHARMHTSAHMHKHVSTHKHRCMHEHTCTCVCMHPCIHTETCMHTCAHSNAHMHKHVHAYTHAHIYVEGPPSRWLVT